MADADYLKCGCQKCGGHIEFPATELGASVICPHCGAQTGLILGNAPQGRALLILLSTGLLLLLAAGLLTGIVSVGKKKSGAWTVENEPASAVRQEVPAPSPSANIQSDFIVGKISLQRAENSGLVYAVGSLKNVLKTQRFGVKVELSLLNEQDENIGASSDYTPVIEPGAEWRFKALVTQPGTAKVTMSNITEQ